MLPRVVLHNVVSADGRTDWFCAGIGLYYELISRWDEDATLFGSDTLLDAVDEGRQNTDDLQSEDGVIDLDLTHVEKMRNDTVWLVYNVRAEK